MLRNLCLIASIMFFVNLGFVYAEPFTYHWEIDETPAGSEEVSVIKPIVVEMLDGTLKISNSIASLILARKYSIYLSEQFDNQHAQLLLSAFETVPDFFYHKEEGKSFWFMNDVHLEDDIIDVRKLWNNNELVIIPKQAFTYAEQCTATGNSGHFLNQDCATIQSH